jgi:hypothetical protein
MEILLVIAIVGAAFGGAVSMSKNWSANREKRLIRLKHRFLIILKTAAVHEVDNPIHIHTPISHVVPQAPGQFSIGLNKLSLHQLPR